MSATFWTLIVLPLLMVMQPVAMSVQRLSMPIDGAESLRYGLLLPDRHDRRQPASVVVALHPGGPRVPYYVAMFVEQFVGPAVRTIDAIVVAPDCPIGAWSDPAAERAVLSLVTRVMAEFAVDKRRVLLVGFSMGASGAWFMSARHPRL